MYMAGWISGTGKEKRLGRDPSVPHEARSVSTQANLQNVVQPVSLSSFPPCKLQAAIALPYVLALSNGPEPHLRWSRPRGALGRFCGIEGRGCDMYLGIQ